MSEPDLQELNVRYKCSSFLSKLKILPSYFQLLHIVSNRCTLAFRPAAAKLELVECDLEKQGDIGPAIGNASTVLCCIGASEKEISDITGPYRIDYKATENLIKAGKSVDYLCLTMLTLCCSCQIFFASNILINYPELIYQK